MYLKIDEELYQRIQRITGTDYEVKGGLVPSENVTEIIADLLLEIDRLEDKYKDFEQEVEDNYKPISYAEQVGYNERDFY